MKKRVRLFLQSTLVLLLIGISVQVHSQPRVVTEVPVNSTGFVTIGDYVYFNVGNELWRTDGTVEGTIFLKTGILTSDKTRAFMGMAMFLTTNGNALWQSDGTPEGTVLLKTFAVANAFMGETPDFLFISASETGTGTELYRTDGSVAGTILLKDIFPGPSSGVTGLGAATMGNNLFFAGNDGTTGDELWKTDGTPNGTVLVTEVQDGYEGISNAEFFALGNYVFFVRHVGWNANEPWVSDGTAEGTHLLKDLRAGDQNAVSFSYEIAHNGKLFFLVYRFTEEVELWSTVGTTASTTKINNVGYASKYHSFLNYNDKISFLNFLEPMEDMWVSDGTADGTEKIYSIAADNSVDLFEVVNGYILLAGTDQGYPSGLHRSDGTEAGSVEFTNFKAFSPYRRDLTSVGDFVFYADHDGPVDEGGNAENPEDYFHLFQTDGFTTQSMRTMFGLSTIGTNNITDFKGKLIFTTHDDRSGATSAKRLWLYDPANASPPGPTLALVDADIDEDIQIINEGDVITKSESTNINIRYNPVETPGSVVFALNDVKVRTETAPPYSLAGDVNGDYAPWQGAQPGAYKLTATPYSESGGQGTAGEALTINFTIEGDEPPPSGCTASGTILREEWNNVSGNTVSSIPTNTPPNSTSQLTLFEGPTNSQTNFGARISGYICPPATGNYTFWIASNDHSELWLSTDDSPSNKRRIAFVTGATNPRQWDKFTSQKSTPITLTSGKRYYIEALHKQGAGSHNIAVGWQLPGGTLERPIPGTRLSPFSDGVNQKPVVTLNKPTEGQTFTAPAAVTFEATASDEDGSISKVEFFNGPTKLGEDVSSPYSFTWQNVPAGVYNLSAKATDSEGATAFDYVSITVNESDGGCTASGTITRDYWANVSGNRVADIPVNSTPTSSSEISIFEGPSNIGSNYGTRIRGYICPPATGNYTFWISSNDHSELWLSTDDDPANRRRIAYITGATGIREWTRFATQQSAPITLTQGKRYYIEALHKQGVGSDNIAVGWRMPSGTLERPIPGNRLSPFEMDAARLASEVDSNGSKESTLFSQISVYPNPAQSTDRELSIAGYDGIPETIETQVQIINLTGEVVYQEQVRCGGDCSTYLMKINQQLVPGIYMVNMQTNGTQHSTRLLVK